MWEKGLVSALPGDSARLRGSLVVGRCVYKSVRQIADERITLRGSVSRFVGCLHTLPT